MLKYNFLKSFKKLRFGYIPFSGRNFRGIICVHHKGGGSKKNAYYVDFFRRINSSGVIAKIIKTPFYSSFLGLIVYKNGLSCYSLLSDDCTIGSIIYSGWLKKVNYTRKLKSGFSLPLSHINLFAKVNNIELYPYSGGSLMRAAGTSTFITAFFENKVLLKLKSGWTIMLSNANMCSYGIASNPAYRIFNFKKAGYKRALGIRPTVRGVVMNPCDHPHGGGEGRKSPLASAKSPWGWLTKGTPTVPGKKQLQQQYLRLIR